jgi:uncharacterized protein YaeQ
MALPSKLYRFKIELSDLEKSIYPSLDLRVAQHPSESMQYLITRVLAYALSYEEGLEFSAGGLSDPDSPCLRVLNPGAGMGSDVQVWIEIGNPSERKLHKASKAAGKVKVYTYKDPEVLMNEVRNHQIHRKEDLEIYSISSQFLERVMLKMKKENRWTLIYNDGVIMLNSDDMTEETELKRHRP